MECGDGDAMVGGKWNNEVVGIWERLRSVGGKVARHGPGGGGDGAVVGGDRACWLWERRGRWRSDGVGPMGWREEKRLGQWEGL